MSVAVNPQPVVVDPWGLLAQDSGDMVQPSQAQIDAGWPESSTPPARQYFNWLFYFCTLGVRYLSQRGLPDWNSGELYQLNARVIGDDGNTYVSIQNSNSGNTPSTSGSWWTRWGFTLAELAGSLISVFTPQRVTLGGNVSLPANTQTVVLTTTVTFPSTAGTNYRVDVRYNLWAEIGSNVINVAVLDSTNGRVFAASGQDSNGTGYVGCSGAEISTQTYAAGATATFELIAISNASSTALEFAGVVPLSPSEPSFLSVTPIAAT
jgi:hypothetical protein